MLTSRGAILLLVLVAAYAVGGCGNNDTIKEDPAATKKRVDAAGEMRSYFDKSGGNYDSLSPEDKAKLDKLTGSEKHSREAFGHMVAPSAGGGLAPHGPDNH
jgi:hypothetical protein